MLPEIVTNTPSVKSDTVIISVGILDPTSLPQSVDMQFAPSQLPSQCNTVERVAAWALYTLASQAGTKSLLEATNTEPERVVQYQTFRAPSGEDHTYFRLTLPLNPVYITDVTAKIWTHVLPIVDANIPAAYSTN